jgi:hypothetical protein
MLPNRRDSHFHRDVHLRPKPRISDWYAAVSRRTTSSMSRCCAAGSPASLSGCRCSRAFFKAFSSTVGLAPRGTKEEASCSRSPPTYRKVRGDVKVGGLQRVPQLHRPPDLLQSRHHRTKVLSSGPRFHSCTRLFRSSSFYLRLSASSFARRRGRRRSGPLRGGW